MKRSISGLMATALLAIATMMAQAGTASGTLEVNGKVFKFTHAYALQVVNWMEKTELATLLLLSDRPLPPKVLNEKVNIFDLRDAGMNGLKMEFYSGGENYALDIVGAGSEGSFSSSGTFDASQFTTFEPTKVAGKFAGEKTFGDTSLKYEVTFETDVMPRKEKVAPSAEDMKAAQNTDSAKAYRAFSEAVRAGKLEIIRAGVVPERAAMMDTPDFKQMLAMIQMMMPTDIQVVKVTEDGDTAELELTGKEGDKEKEGTASMRKINGKWLVQGESWR